jgi:hypothetical protein
MIVFAATSVDLARQVVAPPKERELWWKYGVLELFPSVALLIMMHPSRSSSRNKAADASPSSMEAGTAAAAPRRGAAKREENSPLIKPAVSYGTPNE